MPPTLLHLRFPADEGCWGIWLPFFLVYPLLLAVSIVLAPLVLLAALVLWPSGWGRRLLLAGPYLWRVIFHLRGLKVDIQGSSKSLLVNFL